MSEDHMTCLASRFVFVLKAELDATIRAPVATSVETWQYTRSVDAQGVPLRTVVQTRGLGDLVASSTTTAYPDDAVVSAYLRGRVVSETEAGAAATRRTPTIGTNRYDYAYDSIGNRQWASVNAVTNVYAANCLNQYTSILCDSASQREPTYDADGNLTNDCTFVYDYDAENRLVSAYPLEPVAGSFAVENAYDHRHRRVRKTVKAFNGSDWSVAETHVFVWDGNNVVLETVSTSAGLCRAIEYFWGPDKSGTEQGAGGVGGLLAVSENGVFYIPSYDHNGNVVCYVSETGSIAAAYVYDPYGNIIEQSGGSSSSFFFGAVSGFISGVRGANKKNLCGAQWHVHVAGSITIGTVTGLLGGKLGDAIEPLVGSWTRTITTSSLTLTIEVNGPNIVTGISGGISSTTAELMYLTAPEEAISTINHFGNKMSEKYEEVRRELDASGNFQ